MENSPHSLRGSRILPLSPLFLTLIMFVTSSFGCYNYVCSGEMKKCTSKSGDNVFVNSNACASKLPHNKHGLSKVRFINRKLKITLKLGDEECYISEDETESHCMKKISTSFPTLLYPGYKCQYGDSAAKCTFGPK
jgi:hypothetical protein